MEKLPQPPVTIHTLRNTEGAARQLAHMQKVIDIWRAKQAKAKAGAA